MSSITKEQIEKAVRELVKDHGPYDITAYMVAKTLNVSNSYFYNVSGNGFNIDDVRDIILSCGGKNRYFELCKTLDAKSPKGVGHITRRQLISLLEEHCDMPYSKAYYAVNRGFALDYIRSEKTSTTPRVILNRMKVGAEWADYPWSWFSK